MRRIRFWAIAIISFFSIAAGTIWHRFLAFSLCTILGFHSTACFVNDSSRVNAAVPPVVWNGSSTIAQNIDIFRNDGGNSPPPPIDIFNNLHTPNSIQNSPMPGYPVPPNFDSIPLPSNQQNPDNIKQSSSTLWLYRAYVSPNTNDDDLLFAAVLNFQQGEMSDGQVDVCKDNCLNAIGNLNLQDEDFYLEKTAWVTEGADLKTTTISGKTHKLFWGELESSNTNEKIFFSIVKINSDSNYKNSVLKVSSSKLTNGIHLTEKQLKPITQDTINWSWQGKQTQASNSIRNFATKNSPNQFKAVLDAGLKAIKESSSQGYKLVQKNVPKLAKFINSPQTSRAIGNIASGIAKNGKAVMPFLRFTGTLGTRFIPVIGQILTLTAIAYGIYDAAKWYNRTSNMDESTYREWCQKNPNWCEFYRSLKYAKELLGSIIESGLNNIREKVKFSYGEMTGYAPPGIQSFTFAPVSRVMASNFQPELLAQSLESEFEIYAINLKEQSSKNSQKNYIAQFGIPGLPNIPGIPGGGTGIIKDAVLTQVVGQLGGFIENERPFNTSVKDVYPTVAAPPGGEFKPSPANLQVFSQALRQANGSPEILLPPGDYEIPGRVFCFKPRSYGPQREAGYPLAPIKGKQAAPLIALNSRYIAAGIPHEDAQVLSWNIQLGVKYEDMEPTSRLIVDRILPEFKQQLSRSFWEDLQAKWGQISGTIPGVPSFDSVIGKLPGEVGEVLNTYQQARASLQQYRDNFDQLQNEMVFGGNAPGSSLDSKYPRGIWSKINDRLYARLLPTTFNGPATMQVRVLDANGNVGQPGLLNSAPQPSTPSRINNSAPQLMNPPQNPTQPAPTNLW